MPFIKELIWDNPLDKSPDSNVSVIPYVAGNSSQRNFEEGTPD
ncbi:MAG: hypothetical protein U5K54_02425 [Cytophagales bacterium]|nr:hypothetical protein [Cytophagales bacterium]